ncbi:MAG: HAMP domain-containing histidine kinase, partial [Myxococcales bacterium]|nr:HAMP domain-containing histidine kinase [Myxococcales bacterium]
MIEQILDLARSRLGKGIPLERKPCNLLDLVANIVDEMQAAHPDHAFKWTGKAACEGSWDSDRLGQVVSNLLGNALEHGDRVSPVEVSMASTPQEAELSVRNLGPPIPTEMLGTIFDPYRQGTRQAKSTELGLGLFIAK